MPRLKVDLNRIIDDAWWHRQLYLVELLCSDTNAQIPRLFTEARALACWDTTWKQLDDCDDEGFLPRSLEVAVDALDGFELDEFESALRRFRYAFVLLDGRDELKRTLQLFANVAEAVAKRREQLPCEALARSGRRTSAKRAARSKGAAARAEAS